MSVTFPVSVAETYAAAHTGCALIDRSTEGRFELLDRDRLALLHRMSTNDVAHLAKGHGRATILTTALARIIDRLIVYERGDVTLAVCGSGRTKAVRGWLQKHIFFQDKVQTRDVGAETCQFGLFGTQADKIAERLAMGAGALQLHDFIETTIAGSSVLLARTYPLPLIGYGYALIGPAALHEAVSAALLATGDVVPGGDAAYELLRIEASLPLSGHELTEDYIPLEAGLWDAISFTKGCYIGQEIIARMESRHKLARTLTRFTFATPVPIGATILSGDRTVGTLTSVALRPDGLTVALGYVKPDALNEPLAAAPPDSSAIPALSASAAPWNVTNSSGTN
ncbi:MAG: CAF17-like 4Fe-4S cluster assembly/insertion protein YgfZ [Aggregatilineales bacterium]